MGKSLRSKVKALANNIKDKLKEEQIFTSYQMRQYLRGVSQVLCKGVCTPPKITLVDNPKITKTAFTDGDEVVINWKSSLVEFFSTAENRFVSFMGLFYHEHAHLIYMDFDEECLAARTIFNGHFYGDDPVAYTPEEQTILVDLLSAMTEEIYRPIFVKVYNHLSNTIADAHDEGKMMEDFGGMAVEAISKTTEALRAKSLPLEEAEEQVNCGNMTKLTAMYNLILELVRFERILCNEPALEQTSEYMKAIHSLARYAEIARWTDDTKEKYSMINQIVLTLWPYIREELNNQQNDGQGGGQNQQNGGQQGPSPMPSEEDIEKILEQLENQNSQVPQAPQGKTSSKAAENSRNAKAGNQPQPGQSGQPKPSQASAEALASAFGQVASGVAQEQAENEVENEQGKTLQHDLSGILSQTSEHKNVPVDVNRIVEVSDSDVNTYNDIMQEVGLYSKRLQKQMLEIMRDLRMGGTIRHKPFGQLIMAEDAYRPDKLMFGKKKAPEDFPDMAISVLVDHSGSMYGERIYMSMKAAMLLHDFATGIGIPVSVAGHRTIGPMVEYVVYTEYDQAGDRDRYRLAQMSANGCNRDGAAIEISASRLEKRPEQIKLLIVISDGAPNHDDYGGEAAEADIRSIVKKYSRKGIEILGAAIGNDREQIARIYGDGFLDITDLSRMPKQMVKIVQRRVLKNL